MRRRELLLLLGSAMTMVPEVRAQQKAMPVIGLLSPFSPDPDAPEMVAFRQGLAEAGYVEGQNVGIEYRWAEHREDRLPGLASELIDRHVGVIAAFTGSSARAAKSQTATIPIVFMTAVDPIESGLVKSLARPEGNLTGFVIFLFQLTPKLLELLHDLIPNTAVFGLLVNPNNPSVDFLLKEAGKAARAIGVQLVVLRAASEAELDEVFASLTGQRIGGLIVSPDPFIYDQRDRILASAASRVVPTVYNDRSWTDAGGLISYGSSYRETHHQVGLYVGRILNGAKPGELPVEQPTRFELVVNLNTAKALGLTVPPSILARADEVIE
jgi:putative ABC transport system substrate-binding protein